VPAIWRQIVEFQPKSAAAPPATPSRLRLVNDR
jgi:hypothetical protein